MTATTAIVGADIHCMDEARTRADAIAWRDGEILAVGSQKQVLEAAGPGAHTIDIDGATALPGFVDAHHHVSLTSLYSGLVTLAPPHVTDIPGLLRTLADASKALEPGRWLVATNWDEMLLSERRPPTRDELDDAVGDRPLFALHYTCHRAVANSRALELAGIGKHTPDPPGGQISRGPGGLPDGLLLERAMSPVEALARPDLIARDSEGYLQRMAAHYRALVAAGITRVADTTVPSDLMPLYREAARRGDVLVPTIVCPVSTSGYLEAPWDVFDGPATGERDGPLTVGPVKLVFDGAPGCAMCIGWWQVFGATARALALSLRLGSLDPMRTTMSLEPRLGRKVRTGIAIYKRQEANDIIRAAAERGFGLATHAIGNEAVDMAVSAYEATGPAVHGAGVARLEHGSFLGRDLVSRIAGCGAAVVAQPFMLTLPALSAAVSVPGLRFFPLRWLFDAGVTVAGSSDYPVVGFDPLDGIRTAVSRRTSRGLVFEPDQCITLDEALAMYTRLAADVCGCLDECGTLEAGKNADMVVLDQPLTDASLEAVKLRATVVAGNVLHGSL